MYVQDLYFSTMILTYGTKIKKKTMLFIVRNEIILFICNNLYIDDDNDIFTKIILQLICTQIYILQQILTIHTAQDYKIKFCLVMH